MTMLECVFTIVTVLVCGAGLSWLFYDIIQTAKDIEEIEAERSESLDADGDRE